MSVADVDHLRGINTATELFVLEPIAQRLGVAPVVLVPGEMTIGSGADCDVQLAVSGVQPQHCLLQTSRSRVRVKALDHRTWHNNLPVKETWLRLGDRLAVGPVEFRVRAVEPWDVLPKPVAVRPISPPATTHSSGTTLSALKHHEQSVPAEETLLQQIAALEAQIARNRAAVANLETPPASGSRIDAPAPIQPALPTVLLSTGSVQHRPALHPPAPSHPLPAPVARTQPTDSRRDEELERLRTELAGKSAQVDRQLAELVIREEALQRQFTELGAQWEQLHSLIQHHEQATSERDLREQQVRLREQQCEQRESDLASREHLSQQNADWATELQSQQEAHSAHVTHQSAELRNRQQTMTDWAAELKARESFIAAQLVDLEQRQTSLQAAEATFQTQVQEFDAQSNVWSQLKETTATQHAQWAADLQAQTQGVEAQRSAWTQSRDAEHGQLAQQREELEALAAQHAERGHELTALEHQLAAQREELARVQAEHEQQRAQFQQETEAVATERSQLTAWRAELETTGAEQSAQHQAERAELSQQATLLNDRDRLLAELSTKLEMQQAEFQRQQSELENQRTQLEEVQQVLDERHATAENQWNDWNQTREWQAAQLAEQRTAFEAVVAANDARVAELDAQSQQHLSQTEEFTQTRAAFAQQQEQLRIDADALLVEGARLTSWSHELETHEAEQAARHQSILDQLTQQSNLLNEREQATTARGLELSEKETALATRLSEIEARYQELDQWDKGRRTQQDELESQQADWNQARDSEQAELARRQAEIDARIAQYEVDVLKLTEQAARHALHTEQLLRDREDFDLRDAHLRMNSQNLETERTQLKAWQQELDSQETERQTQHRIVADQHATQAAALEDRERVTAELSEQLTARNTELQDLAATLDQRQAELDQQQEQHQQQMAELELHRSEWEQAKAAEAANHAQQRDELQSRLAQHEQDIAEFVANSERHAGEVEALRGQQQEAERQREQLHLDSQQMESDKDRLNQREQELTTSSTELAAKEHAYGERLAALEERERTNAESSQQLGAKQSELEQHSADLAAREQACAEQTGSLEAREQTLASRSSELDSQETELKYRTADLAAREQAHAESLASLDAREHGSADWSQQLSQRESELEHRAAEVTVSEQVLVDRSSALDAKEQANSELSWRLSARETELQEQVASLDQRRTELDQAAEAHRQQVEAHAASMSVWNQSRESDDAETLKKRQELEAQVAQHQALLQEVQQSQQTCEAQAVKLREEQAQLADETARGEQARHEVETARSELAAVQAELEELETRLAERESELAERDAVVAQAEIDFAWDARSQELANRQSSSVGDDSVNVTEGLAASDTRLFEQITAERDTLAAELFALSQAHEDLIREERVASDELAASQSLAAQEAELVAKWEELRNEQDSLNLLNEFQQTRHAELAQIRGDLEQQLVDVTKLVTHHQADADRRREEYEAQQAEYERLQAELERRLDEHERLEGEFEVRSEALEQETATCQAARQELDQLRADLEQEREFFEQERADWVLFQANQSPEAAGDDHGTHALESISNLEDVVREELNQDMVGSDEGELSGAAGSDGQDSDQQSERIADSHGEATQRDAAPEDNLRARLAEMFNLDLSQQSTSHDEFDEAPADAEEDTTEPPELTEEYTSSPSTAPQLAAVSEPDEEEYDSVESYMQRLLERNKTSREESSPYWRSTSSPQPVVAPAAPVETPAVVSDGDVATPEDTEVVASAETARTAPPRAPIDAQKVRAGLQSLRQVANDSARLAIARSKWNKVRTRLAIQGILSGVSAVLGLMVIIGHWLGYTGSSTWGWASLGTGLCVGVKNLFDIYKFTEIERGLHRSGPEALSDDESGADGELNGDC